MPGGASMVTDWPMVSDPYPPESSATTSPAGLVTAIAAAKLRQGSARVHGLESDPDPAETKVRGAAAKAIAGTSKAISANARTAFDLCMSCILTERPLHHRALC